ncbi:zinc finger SWIM domain-containing protein 7 isoform X4 [Pseudophryne corroboree]|uniref:zinc finger SWIM domain-containing protein 7 isoform X4 n=1 Tax=Pseudophryne corroboree TaxID=495146 RepID=UPI003081C8CD
MKCRDSQDSGDYIRNEERNILGKRYRHQNHLCRNHQDQNHALLQEALVKCTPVIRPATTAPVLPSLSLCSDGMKVWWCAKKTLLCKHILAVYLSQAMGTCQELMVSDKQMIEILLAKED